VLGRLALLAVLLLGLALVTYLSIHYSALDKMGLEQTPEVLTQKSHEIIARLGYAGRTDVIVTTDHGELQGDFGLLFKGPYHVDGLLRLPLIWRAAPSHPHMPAVVSRPVGLIDLAPTFLQIAGVTPPRWMEGKALPVSDGDAVSRGFDAAVTEWDSALFGVDVHLRTIVADGWLLTRCDRGALHDGSEGELYNLADDPLQWENRFADPAASAVRDQLLARLADHDAREVVDRATPGRLVAPV